MISVQRRTVAGDFGYCFFCSLYMYEYRVIFSIVSNIFIISFQ